MSHLALISASHRPTGNSPRITRFIEDQLKAAGHTTYVLDLATTELPFWDEGLWGAEGLSAKWEKLWNPIKDELTKAEAYVIVAPEYHGMLPSKLTNLFLLIGNGFSVVGHKPALAVSVSASNNGVYPISELRAFSAKNNRLVYLPDHLIIRSAGEIFQPETKPEHEGTNAYITERLHWLLGMLESYTQAFKTIRANTKNANDKFANGM